jgi:hypothetical protein
MDACQSIRHISDLMEPFVVKQLQKKHHSHFVFRASDYDSFERLVQINKLNYDLIKYIDPIKENWSAIDIIYFKIKELPEYNPTQEYFRFMDNLRTENKTIIDIEIYEVKTITSNKPSILSVKTDFLQKELKKFNKLMKCIKVYLSGQLSFNLVETNLKDEDFVVQTHYGRKGYYIGEKYP